MMCLKNSFLSVILLCVLGAVCGYNVDTVNYVKHKGQPSSMFGFAVSSHIERGQSWVLVGAPEAQTSLSRVERGGSVFKCAITDDDYCQEVPFDRRDDNTDGQGVKIDSKAHQWFGATLNAPFGEDTPIVACAPRYVWFANKRDRKDPVGTCYVARDGSYSEYSPCRTNLFGYHRQGSCQAGFSAAISKDGKNLFIGAPGSWYWQGQLYSVDAHATFPYSPGKFGGGPFGTGQVVQQSLETRPSVIATVEGPAIDDDSYMGYSLAVGLFFGARQQEAVAVGMPRSTNLEGKVLLWTWNLTLHSNFTGHQLGSYFGYSIAAVDVNGDGRDEIIVGAPMHTVANNEGKYEVGRVHVLFTGGAANGHDRITLDGYNSKSRFGLAVASVGDINLDGYGDFAVGAPYDGPNERGAVYIFHGFVDGVREKYAQAIYAEDMTQQGGLISTFGFSIAGNGMDLDGNRYPDVVVGAYLADTAFFFRSRPVIKMDVTINFMTSNRHIILDEKNCTLNNREKVPCTTLDICFKYSGVGVPSAIDLEIQTVLDARKKKAPRMFFLQQEGRNIFNETVKLQKDVKICGRPRVVYIKSDVRDKLTQLEAEVRYSMREAQIVQEGHQRNPRAGLLPVLDLSSPPVKKDVISIKKNCGLDNICIPNLKLNAQPNVERYLLGSNEKLEIDVIVQNEGEDSFESTFNLQIPPGMDFIRISENNNTEVRVLCSSSPNNSIQCDIGNPLPARRIAKFRVQLNPYHKEGMNPSYDFLMSVNSTNPEHPSTISDNTKAMSIHIWVDSKLELKGTSKPAEIHYNTSQYIAEKIVKESDIGPQVIHVYSIRNNGPSGITEAEMSFIWPFQTESGEDLFYLLEQPAIIGNARCEPVDANYRNYELEYRKKTIWESIGIDVSKGDFTIASNQIAGDFSSSSSGSRSSSSSFDSGTSSSSGSEIRSSSSGSSSSSSSSGSSSSSTAFDGKNNVKFDSGDASFVHEERGRLHGSQTSTGGGYQNQGGSTYSREGGSSYASGAGYSRGEGQQQQQQQFHNESLDRSGQTLPKTDSGWNKTTTHNGPVTTHTYTKNYTMYSDSDLNKTRGNTSAGSSSADISGSTSTQYRGVSNRPKIIYTTSGSQRGQEANRLAMAQNSEFPLLEPQLGGGGAGGSSSSSSGYQWRTNRTEENKSGQNLRGSVEGGTIPYVAGGAGKTTDRAFDWNEQRRQGTSGASSEFQNRGGSSFDNGDGTNYNQQNAGTGSGTNYRASSGSGQAGHVDQRYYHQQSAGGQHQQVDQQSYGRGEDRRADKTSAERANSNDGDLYENVYSSEEYSGAENGITEGRVVSSAASSGGGGNSRKQQHGQIAGGQQEEGHYRHQSGRNRSTYGHYDRNYEEDVARHGLGAAALGHGFQTTSLDLGVLGGNRNVDETVSSSVGSGGQQQEYAAASSGDISGRGHASSGQSGQGAHSSQSSSSSWSRQNGQGSAEQRATWEAERARHSAALGGADSSHSWSSHSESQWSSRSSTPSPPPSEFIGRDNVPTDKPDMRNQFVGRRRRQAVDIGNEDIDITDLMHCKSTKCLQVRCTVGPLDNGEDALIALRARLNIRTLKGISTSQPVSLSTMLLARISKLPYIGRPLDPPTYNHEIFTTVEAPEPDIQPDIVPLWVVVLSAVAGTLILLLLIFLLYKCGFFKRHRPNESAERQPLNRNGHYQNGDEAL